MITDIGALVTPFDEHSFAPGVAEPGLQATPGIDGVDVLLQVGLPAGVIGFSAKNGNAVSVGLY